MGRFGLLACFLILCAITPAAGAPPTRCAPGIFVVDEPLPLPEAGRLTVGESTIAFSAGCTDPVRARVKAKRKRTKIAATWPSCTGISGRVKLKAAIAAPACDVLTGGLQLRTKPRRRKLHATRLVPAELVTALSDPETQKRMLDENFPYLIRAAAEPYNPELTDLIALGPAAVDALLAPFADRATLADDIPLSLFAYALERIGDPRAVPVLADWLDRNLFASTLWATEFVTHTIKVLAGQGGLAPDFLYDIDEKLDTLARARAGATGATGAALTPLVELPPEKNKCEGIVSVTGINGDGVQETVKLNYAMLFYDIQAQVDLESEPTKSRLAAQLANLRANDEANYGSSDYRATGDVSVASNCGGSVTERLLNGVAAQRGLPLRLGAGNASADDIRDVARKFGGPISGSQLDPLTVIAHERPGGGSLHVEIPLSVNGDSAVIYSKDNQGAPRLHTVDTGNLTDAFSTIQQLYNFRPFGPTGSFESSEPRFYRIDPSRILDIRLDTSACPCEFAYGGVIPVAITEPAESTTTERVVTVAGTVGDLDVQSGNLRLNGSAQALAVSGGAFSSQVVLASGDNTIRVAVDGADGRRGCAEKMVRSDTKKTTLSATLTWNLDATDVDLYVTQPDGETAWYGARTTTIGGQLDVDNTQGIGPENYFLSSAEGDTVVMGAYAIRVHYYADHQATVDTPTRPVTWRVALVLNEGTPEEKREFYSGVLSGANSSNSTPGSGGADWADVAQPAL